jgi:hypothetical protein
MKTEQLAGTCRVYHNAETIGKAAYAIELLRETDVTHRSAADGRVDSYERYTVSLTDHELQLDGLRGETLTLHLQDGRRLKVIVARNGFIATGRLR